MKYALIAALAALLTACGGGGGDSPQPDPHYQVVAPVPLRPCETTGPTAPPCPSAPVPTVH